MTATPPRRLAHRLSAAFCAYRRARVLLRWPRAELARGSVRGAAVGATAGHSGPAPDARARRLPAGATGPRRATAAFANRQRARAGGDPRAEKRHGQGAATVEEAAAEVLEQQRPGWRNAKHARDWPRSLRAYAFPRIGAMPVSEVTTADVLAVLTPIGHDKPETARRVRQRNRCRDEVGGRHGLPAGQPGWRRPRAGARAAAGRRPAHAGAAPRLGGGRPRDRASLPGLGPPPSGRSSSWC